MTRYYARLALYAIAAIQTAVAVWTPNPLTIGATVFVGLLTLDVELHQR